MARIPGHSLLVKAALALLAVSLLLGGCGTATPPPAETGAKFVAARTADIQKLVPFQTTDANSGTVIGLISEGLVGYTDDYVIEPRLATEWTNSDDYLTWTFTLREDVVFHDGSPFTSEDVKFTFDSIKDPTQGSNQTKEFEFIESVETPDEYTVVFHLNHPYGPIMHRMTMGILSKTYVQAKGFDADKYNGYNPEAVGTGPYKMKNWVPDDHVELIANEEYWGGKPEIETVIIRVIPDDTVRLAAFEQEEVDFIFEVPHAEVARLSSAASDDYTVFNYLSYSFAYMTWNNNLPLFQDSVFRQALAHATDKQSIIDNIIYGHAVKSNAPYSPSHAFFNTDIGEPYPYDPEKAIQILEEAGYTKGDDGIFVNPDGIKCSFETLVRSDREVNQNIALLLKAWFEEIGVELVIKKLSLKEIYDIMDEVIAGRAPEENYSSMIGSMGTGVDPDMTRYLHSAGGLNDYRYSNERIDELFSLGIQTVDEAERRVIYDEIQMILATDLPCLMLYHPETNNAVSNKFQGMTATPYGQVNKMHKLTLAP